MIGRRDLQGLAHTRLREAEALYAAGLYDGSVYLCGYVLEMALKACVCKTLDIPGYPDTEPGVRQFLKMHDFGSLELLAGLRTRVAEQKRLSPEFERSWNRLILWNVDLRYRSSASRRDAEDMLEALRSVPGGVLVWLSQQW